MTSLEDRRRVIRTDRASGVEDAMFVADDS